jgi:hypothetical protein
LASLLCRCTKRVRTFFETVQFACHYCAIKDHTEACRCCHVSSLAAQRVLRRALTPWDGTNTTCMCAVDVQCTPVHAMVQLAALSALWNILCLPLAHCYGPQSELNTDGVPRQEFLPFACPLQTAAIAGPQSNMRNRKGDGASLAATPAFQRHCMVRPRGCACVLPLPRSCGGSLQVPAAWRPQQRSPERSACKCGHRRKTKKVQAVQAQVKWGGSDRCKRLRP